MVVRGAFAPARRHDASWITRWRGLPPSERRAAALVMVLLVVARPSVRWAGVARTRAVLSRLASLGRATASGRLLPSRVAQLTSGASRCLPGTTRCLARSLVVEALLLATGHPAELRIGVAGRNGDRVDAHAWVEIAGVAVAEDASRYTALPLFGAGA